MADLVPAGGIANAGAAAAPRLSLLTPLTDPVGGTPKERVLRFIGQPAVRKALPAIAGIGAATGAALLWLATSNGPQRVLYTNLSDHERAQVVQALDQGSIGYMIDNSTGMLSVGEDDLYRARMLVASNDALAVPEHTSDMLDSIPMGASRTLEGERLRNVRERELMLTIMEIDGIEAVRVHLATPERSVFLREQTAPTASVMVRRARGRSLSPDQVTAIGNLVAAAVPGMSPDAVRVVDQNGKLLSDEALGKGSDTLDLQRRHEEKLRAQIAQLLIPIVGSGNFSTEVQVQLDMDEVTSARENYDKDGALRSETQSQSSQQGNGRAGGVPGVLANTPPPPTQIDPNAPQGTQEQPAGETSGESSARRTYELGRQVAVSSTMPGSIKRVSVAVALSAEALKTIKPASVKQIEELVSAAVGANVQRGDQVTVIASAFDPIEAENLPFYETGWFGTVLRNGVFLIAVILTFLFVVRPGMKALKARAANDSATATESLPDLTGEANFAGNAIIDRSDLREQVDLARKLAAEQPDRVASSLRQMLAAPPSEAAS